MQLIETQRGRTLVYKEKLLLSKVAPMPSCEKLCAALPVFERTLYLCVSPLFGYGLQSLLDRLPDSSALFCVEKEPALAALSLDYIPQKTREHPRFFTEAALAESLRKGREFRRVVRFNLSNGFCFHSEYYDELETKLQSEITREWSNAATLVKLGRRYALNFIRNLRLLEKLPSAAGLSGGAEGGTKKSLIVLGAGPSLDAFFKNADLQKDRAAKTIVCADSALPALAAHGIKADIAVALEAQHWNLRDFIGCQNAASALAMDMSALPATASCMNAPVFLFWTPWARLNIFERLRPVLPFEMPPLGNVGITSYYLARCLFSANDNMVSTYGLDFSFTADQYHCRESSAHIDLLRTQTRFKSLIPASRTLRSASFSHNGSRSDPVMQGYRNLFEKARASAPANAAKPTLSAPAQTNAVKPMLTELRSELEQIRAILSGKAPPEKLSFLLEANDYLFAHFPDYAALEKAPDVTDISFLKRISAELDAFLALL